MINTGSLLLEAGYAPYIPGLDFLPGMMTFQPLPGDHFAAASMAWLEVADVVLLTAGESEGARAEVERAEELGIPVVHSFPDLIQYQREHLEKENAESRRRGGRPEPPEFTISWPSPMFTP